jgi:hypothetical protein
MMYDTRNNATTVAKDAIERSVVNSSIHGLNITSSSYTSLSLLLSTPLFSSYLRLSYCTTSSYLFPFNLISSWGKLLLSGNIFYVCFHSPRTQRSSTGLGRSMMLSLRINRSHSPKVKHLCRNKSPTVRVPFNHPYSLTLVKLKQKTQHHNLKTNLTQPSLQNTGAMQPSS